MVEKTDAFEALKVLANIVPQKLKTADEWFPAYVTMIKYLRNSEPVRRGKWIYIYNKGYIPYNYQCSECGARSILFENYCPNCGARMEE